MSRIPDEKGVEAMRTPCEEAGLGCSQPESATESDRPAVTDVVPHRHVLLLHVHTCFAQARHDLRVARVIPLVRSEVTDSQRCAYLEFERTRR